jgi:hypothetical protein
VNSIAANPANAELRRRLEGCLHAFVAADKNLQPYFDDDILSTIVSPANKVLEWLKLCTPNVHDEDNPLYNLRTSMQHQESWVKFTENCHMASKIFANELKKCHDDLKNHNDAYKLIQLEIIVSPDVCDWCLMTHIPRLIAYLSNIALEPAKYIRPTSPSRVNINSCMPGETPSLNIDVFTSFGTASSAYKSVKKSAKISHSESDLKEFGIKIDINETKSDELQFSLVVPVGFQPQRR